MKVELHVNGHIVVELHPQDEIEKLVLDQMLNAANKGQRVELFASPDKPGSMEIAISR